MATTKIDPPHGTTFELLLRALKSEYRGDPSSPGVVTAFIDDAEFYSSILRYKGAYGEGKQMVCNGRGPELGRVLRNLCQNWLANHVSKSTRAEVVALRERISEPYEVEGH